MTATAVSLMVLKSCNVGMYSDIVTDLVQTSYATKFYMSILVLVTLTLIQGLWRVRKQKVLSHLTKFLVGVNGLEFSMLLTFDLMNHMYTFFILCSSN